MAEYIDREAAIAYLENHKRIGKEQGVILAANEDAIIKFLKEKCPTADVVEVVRCKDCKHYYTDFDCDGWYACDTLGGLHEPDGLDFCSYGERKEQK